MKAQSDVFHSEFILRRLVTILLACAVLIVGMYTWRQLSPAVRPFDVEVSGTFVPEGQYPGESLNFAEGIRTWGSWAGDDGNEGTLKLGPFPAPASLKLALSGYPHRAGNELFLEMPSLGIRFPLDIDDIGERWTTKMFEVPTGWQGRLINIVAIDRAQGPGGWLALSEPLVADGGATIEFGFAADIAAWGVNGILLSVLFYAAIGRLRHFTWLPEQWLALTAIACVALAGYVAFWAYFIHPFLGHCYALLLLGIALLAWIRLKHTRSARDLEWITAVKLLAGVGLLYVALLHLFHAERDAYDLASNRFVEGLPGDNRIPHDLAIRLYQGQSARNLSADWLSSDRPPLQSGWLLLTWAITSWVGFGATTASNASAVWFQLAWVAAAYGLFRTLGVARWRASLVTSVVALSGFFVQNTIFTWPKLSAAAFACGTFALWTAPPKSGHIRRRLVVGAVLAALAWLSHGGVAFAILPLLVFVVWRFFRSDQWSLVVVGLTLLGLCLPWSAYQTFYDPPGNRLLKWHIAGQINTDACSFSDALKDNYGAISWRQIWQARVANLKTQVKGNWNWWREFSFSGAPERRSDEFYHQARSLGWWLLGFLALAALIRREGLVSLSRHYGTLTLWIISTLFVWVALMFAPHSAVIHQGPYTLPLGLFVLLSGWLERLSLWVLSLVASLQTLSFATTWIIDNPTVQGAINSSAFCLMLAAIAVLATTIAFSYTHQPTNAETVG